MALRVLLAPWVPSASKEPPEVSELQERPAVVAVQPCLAGLVLMVQLLARVVVPEWSQVSLLVSLVSRP